MSELTGMFSPKVRKIAYVVFAVLGVAFGAVQTGFGTAGAEAPLWLDVAFQVYLYVGGAFGLIAAQNVSSGSTDYGEIVDLTEFEESDDVDEDSEYEPKHAA